MLQGRGSRAQIDVVAFNTALVLWAAGREMDLTKAVQQALDVIGNGLPWQRLEALRVALADQNGE